jgi:uncharacterized protein (TIGR03067 family)
MKPLIACLALSLLVGADSPKGEAKNLQEKLQGTWKAVSVERGGETRQEQEDHRLIFDGNKFRVKQGEWTIIQGSFKVDSSKKPHAIDMKVAEDQTGKHTGKTAPGILALDGDTLKCVCCRTGHDRATQRFLRTGGYEDHMHYPQTENSK